MTGGRPPADHVPPPAPVPPPPADFGALDPLPRIWPAGTPLVRCYDASWGPRDFHAGDAAHPGRFHPFAVAGGSPPPVLYAAGDLDGALSETVFHDVPIRGVKHVPIAKLRHRLVVSLVAHRDLRLVDLTSGGLHRLGVSRSELIDSDPGCYPATARWAHALHRHPGRFDGLTWVSRQRDTSLALMLFGDRVATADLALGADAIPLPLAFGSGLERVLTLADRANITIVGPW